MTFQTKPNLQALLPQLQQRLQQNVQSGPIGAFSPVMVATLPFDIATQVVKWTHFSFTVGALAKVIQADLPLVPKDETHTYHAISVDNVDGWETDVLYPADGILAKQPRFVDTFQASNLNFQNLLNSEHGANDFGPQGPLRIYPGGLLRILSVGVVAALTVLDFHLLWTVAPAPLQAGAEVSEALVTEV